MPYQHGISVRENTPKKSVKVVNSGIQVVVGTAPIHMVANPEATVNVPIVAYTMDDVKRKIGFSSDFDKFTLSQAAYASFELLQVAPVVFINVLDPKVHKKDVAEKALTLNKGTALIDDTGVLLKSIVIKSGSTTLVRDKDYISTFDKDGKVSIVFLSNQTGSVTAGYQVLDPSAVTAENIIGGYDSVSGVYSGLELIERVHPQLGLVPGQLLAPGWSHKPLIGAVLQTKVEKINGNFNAQAILDIDSSVVRRHQDAESWKNTNNYTGKRSITLWPKVKVGDKALYYSAVYAAAIAKLDAENEDVPYKSPSNKKIPISATVVGDGTEVYLDQTQANTLNAAGINTALNWNGWRTWGNNMAIFPNIVDPQDQFISVRRMLDWWGNTFILSYFDKVDNPLDTRLIETVVDSENIRANGFQARGQIAGAKIEFRKDMNPDADILKGKIVFNQRIGLFGPAEHIENILEFDPTITTAAILGGE